MAIAASGALALGALAVLVASFRGGSASFVRMGPAALLALFAALVLGVCGGSGELDVLYCSPVTLGIICIAVSLLALSGCADIVRHRRVRAVPAASLGAAVVLAGLYAAMRAGAIATLPFRSVVSLLAFETLWLAFALIAFVIGNAAYRVCYPAARVDIARPFAYIVVHGAKIFGTKPSPLLASRIDAARELWERQGGFGHIVVSGGQGADEVASEAAVMRDWLLRRGVPATAIVEEDRSATTLENLVFSNALMDRLSGGAPYRVALATSEFHVFRCATMARRLGLDAEVVAAPTRLATWLRSFVREFGGVLIEYPRQFGYVALLWLAATMVC